MDKKTIVFNTLNKYGCVSSKQLAGWVKKTYNVDMSATAVSGVLRGLTAKGLIGSSNCGNGSTVYWVIKDENRVRIN